VARITAGGFAFAGQSCISVQRVYVHDRLFDDFANRLVSAVEKLNVGDPLDPSTDLGPMIEEDEAARIDDWVKEALAQGAKLLTGGKRLGGALYAPTVLTHVPREARVCAQEVFAPLVVLERFTSFDAALEEVNRSTYGLQAGVFTANLEHSLKA